MNKPEKSLKEVAEQIEKCLYHNDCRGCWVKQYSDCQQMLMVDGLYYLKEMAEKEK